MSINTRFPVAVHILCLIAIKGETLTSETVASSVNTNPVVIRKINALLKKSNLISVKVGVAKMNLNHDPSQITLLDIYKAVQPFDDNTLFDLHSNPNQKCDIGTSIHHVLTKPLSEAQHALENTLAQYTLEDMIVQIKQERNL